MSGPKVAFEKYQNPYSSKKIDDDDDEGQLALKNALVTPDGILPIHDASYIDKKFNFWILHTNFRMNQEMFDVLNLKISGIETLNVLTPYRIRIAIGRMFDEEGVKRVISDKLITIAKKYFNKPNNLEVIISSCLSPFFAVYFDGDKPTIYSGKTREEVESKIETYKGNPTYIYKSWEKYD